MQKYCIVVSIITWDFCIIVHSRRLKDLVIVKISPSSLSERWQFRSCILYTRYSCVDLIFYITLVRQSWQSARYGLACLHGLESKHQVWIQEKNIRNFKGSHVLKNIFFLAGKSYWNSQLITKKDNWSINRSIYQSINQ